METGTAESVAGNRDTVIPFVTVLAFSAGGFVLRRERIRMILLIGCILIAAATHVASLLAIARASGA